MQWHCSRVDVSGFRLRLLRSDKRCCGGLNVMKELVWIVGINICAIG